MLHDLRFALRTLLKSPGFAVIAIITLALAIGANTAIFSAVDAVLLHPLSFPHPDRLVIVEENLPRFNLHRIPPSGPNFAEYRRRATCFNGLFAMIAGDVTLTGHGAPQDVYGVRITPAGFPTLGVAPILGALFTAEEEQPGKDRVAILSEGLWTNRYGRDRSIVGKSIRINRESYRVVGVIPAIPYFRGKVDIWTPLAFTPDEIAPGSRRPHYVDTIGRLKAGVTIEQARQEFRAIGAQLLEQYPDQAARDRGFSVDVRPLSVKQAGDLGTPMLVLVAAAGALMLIACANVSNLLLARGLRRRKELSIRAALGAARGRVVRLLLAESFLLALGAGMLGVLCAFYAPHLFTEFSPDGLIAGKQPAMNLWVLLFSIGVSISAIVLFGFAPSLAVSRVDLADSLRDASRGSTTGRRLLRESMIGLEVAVSLVLLIATGLLIRSFQKVASESPGFQPAHVLAASVSLPAAQYREAAQRAAFTRTLLERARSLPGVRSAATIDFIPYLGGPGSGIGIPGRPREANEPTVVVWQNRASPGFFRTLGIPLLRGRDFLPSDEQGTPGAAIIDETVAKLFFAGVDPIGRQVTLPFPGITIPIVGVVGATKSGRLATPPPPRIYYSVPQVPFPAVSLLLKTSGDPMQMTSAVRRQIAALDAELPVTSQSMDQILADSLERQRFALSLMSGFAILAALLTAIGIYSVLAYLADQRRGEFGIRLALGARPLDVLALVLRQGSIPIGAGLGVGIAGAFALTRLLGSLLYGVSPTDPAIFALVVAGLIAVAFVAVVIPASRATRIDPAEALRHE